MNTEARLVLFTIQQKERNMSPYTRAKFKIKIRLLAEEARIIKQVSKKHGGQYAYVAGGVLSHNDRVVAVEQRHTLLAYAFLRDKSYRSVERDAVKPVDFQRVARIVGSLNGFKKAPQQVTTDVMAWVTQGSTPSGRQPAFNPAQAGSTPALPSGAA